MKMSSYLVTFLLLCLSLGAFADIAKHNSHEQFWTYSVVKDDSFELIYQKYLNKHRANILALSQINHHPLTKKLQPGQMISVPVEMLRKVPMAAQVTVVYGEAEVISQRVSEKRKLNKGDLLSQGDSLQTGKNSLVKLLFSDGSIADVQSNSYLSIQDSFKYLGKETYVTRLKLVQGRTEIAANPSHSVGNTLQVQTPSAIAAVRGTQFRVATNNDVTLQETLDGQVAFSANSQEVMLAKGYGSLAEKNKAPLPPMLLPATPDLSALPKLINEGDIVFQLTSQPSTVAWATTLALDANFTQILNEQTTSSGNLAFNGLADGQYYLKIRAQDSHGLQGADAVHAFNVKLQEKFAALALFEPLDGASFSNKNEAFSWSSLAGIKRYVLEISRDADFSTKIYERQVSYNQLVIPSLFDKGEYYWRVTAYAQNKPQLVSNVRKFSLSDSK